MCSYTSEEKETTEITCRTFHLKFVCFYFKVMGTELHFSKDDLDLFSGNFEKIKNICLAERKKKGFPSDKFKMKRKLPPKH